MSDQVFEVRVCVPSLVVVGGLAGIKASPDPTIAHTPKAPIHPPDKVLIDCKDLNVISKQRKQNQHYLLHP